MQIMSNGVINKPEDVEKEVRRYYGGQLPPPVAMPYSVLLRELFFASNVLECSANALRGLDIDQES